MHPRLVTLAALVAFPLAMAGAQSATPRNVLSIQPLTAVLGVYSAEFERAAGKGRSWGIGATYWGSGFGGGNTNYTSAEFKFRGYPAGVALNGFSVGGAVGFTNVTSDDYYNGTEESFAGPSLGVLLEYQWLLGEQKEWAFTLGAGAKAIFIGDRNSSFDFTGKYPTARISFGYAF